MNNYRGYSPPIPNFPPHGRHQHQKFPNRPPVHGPYRSPNYDDKRFYRQERSGPYPRTPYFERTSLCNSPPSAMRHAYRDEDFNMYRENPQFRHLRKEDVYNNDRLYERDQRNHLQNSSITNYSRDSSDKISHPYSDTDRFNAKNQSFFNMEQNYSSVRQDEYPDFSNNVFPRQNTCDVPSPFKSFKNLKNYDRNVDSVQGEPTSNKIITSPVYSKKNSHSDLDTFSEKQNRTVPFPQKQNLISDDMQANKSSPVKQKILDDDAILKHIKGMEKVLEQQKKLKELDEEVSLASRIVHSPNLMDIANLKSFNKLPNLFNNQGFSNNAAELKNASDIKFQTSIFAEKESSSDESYKLLGKKINNCLSKSHSPVESEDLNENVITNFDSSLEEAIFGVKKAFEKSEIVPDLSKKTNSNYANNKLNEKLDTSSSEVFIEGPIPTTDDVKTDLLNKDKVFKNSNGNFVTEENEAYDCHDNNSELKSKIFEIINTVPNSPCKKLFDENRSKPETYKNCSQMSESLSSKTEDSIPFLEEPDSQLVSSPPKLNLNAAGDLMLVKSAATSERNQPCSGEDSVNESVLEHAITSLEIYSPVVGLDFIVEDKRNLLVDGSFPFRCKLCNSSIARTMILDHILGSKHRLRYVKIKDEATYDLIMHLSDQDEKNKNILEATARLEMEFGRGKVVVSSSKGTKDLPTTNFGKILPIDENMDFDCNVKSDTESKETIDSKQSKNENEILSSFTKSLENKLRSSESLNSIISSYSSELTSNDEKSIQGHLNELSSTKREFSSNIKEETSESVDSLSDIHHHYKFSNENSSIKRTFSPFELEIPKKLKNDLEYGSMDMNVNAFKDSNAQTTFDPPFHSSAIPEQKCQSGFFSSSLLEHLSKCNISSDDEANIVLLAVNVLMKLLLRYKLKDCVNVDVENLMSTLHCRSSQELIEILDLMKRKKLSEDKNICSPLKMEERIANTYSLKDETKLQMSNTAYNLNYSTKKGMAFQSSDYVQLSNAEIENVDRIQGMNTIAQNLESYIQSMGSSNSGFIPSTMNVSQTSKTSLLQQPSFLGWPNSSNVISSTKQSLANVTQPGQSNIVWNSPYSNLAFYQQPAYGVSLYQPYSIQMLPLISSRSLRLISPRKRVPQSFKSKPPLTKHSSTAVRSSNARLPQSPTSETSAPVPLATPSTTKTSLLPSSKTEAALPHPATSEALLLSPSITRSPLSPHKAEAELPPPPTPEIPLPAPPTLEAPLPPPPIPEALLPPPPVPEALLPPPPVPEVPLPPPPIPEVPLPPPPIPEAPLPPPPIPEALLPPPPIPEALLPPPPIPEALLPPPPVPEALLPPPPVPEVPLPPPPIPEAPLPPPPIPEAPLPPPPIPEAPLPPPPVPEVALPPPPIPEVPLPPPPIPEAPLPPPLVPETPLPPPPVPDAPLPPPPVPDASLPPTLVPDAPLPPPPVPEAPLPPPILEAIIDPLFSTAITGVSLPQPSIAGTGLPPSLLTRDALPSIAEVPLQPSVLTQASLPPLLTPEAPSASSLAVAPLPPPPIAGAALTALHVTPLPVPPIPVAKSLPSQPNSFPLLPN